MSLGFLYTDKTKRYTIWESVPRAEWLPSDGKSWTNRGTFKATNAYSAIEQAAHGGYYVKAGDKITHSNGPEIIIKTEGTV